MCHVKPYDLFSSPFCLYVYFSFPFLFYFVCVLFGARQTPFYSLLQTHKHKTATYSCTQFCNTFTFTHKTHPTDTLNHSYFPEKLPSSISICVYDLKKHSAQWFVASGCSCSCSCSSQTHCFCFDFVHFLQFNRAVAPSHPKATVFVLSFHSFCRFIHSLMVFTYLFLSILSFCCLSYCLFVWFVYYSVLFCGEFIERSKKCWTIRSFVKLWFFLARWQYISPSTVRCSSEYSSCVYFICKFTFYIVSIFVLRFLYFLSFEKILIFTKCYSIHSFIAIKTSQSL